MATACPAARVWAVAIARSVRTIRTADAFSSGLYLRLVGFFPDDA
jgi:hypothetical protein